MTANLPAAGATGGHERPPDHHPASDLLVAHAAGQLDLSMRIVLEVHLAYCRDCRLKLGEDLRPAARWCQNLPGEEPTEADWRSLQARLEPPAGDPLSQTPLPAAARYELAHHRPLIWRRLPGSTARVCRLVADSEPGVTLLIASITGGRSFPRHYHIGCEQVVVLAGGYRDPFGHFDVGDFYHYPADTEHRPATDPGSPCWVATRIEGGVRFLGWRGWVVQLARALSRRSS